jgi:hypothetical protein
MGIVNGGPALASTRWSVVDAAGESLAAHALHIALPEVRFTRPDRTPCDVLHSVAILLWDHSEDKPAAASAAGTSK